MNHNISMVDLHSLHEESETFSVEGGSSQHEGTQIKQHRRVSPSDLRGPGDTALRAQKKQPRKRALTEDERKMRRILSNRRSAKASRDSRRKLLTNLSAKVAIMSTENAALAKTNTELRAQTRHLRMRLQCALDSLETQAASSASAPPPPSLRTTPDIWFPQARFLPQGQQQERLASLQFQCQPSGPHRGVGCIFDATQCNPSHHSADMDLMTRHHNIMVPSKQGACVVDLQGSGMRLTTEESTLAEGTDYFQDNILWNY